MKDIGEVNEGMKNSKYMEESLSLDVSNDVDPL